MTNTGALANIPRRLLVVYIIIIIHIVVVLQIKFVLIRIKDVAFADDSKMRLESEPIENSSTNILPPVKFNSIKRTADAIIFDTVICQPSSMWLLHCPLSQKARKKNGPVGPSRSGCNGPVGPRVT